MREYSRNIWSDNARSLALFVPANFLNFLFMPVHLRGPFATAFGAVWAIMLSVTRGDAAVATSAAHAPVTTAEDASSEADAASRPR
jgi:hypothetical protein